MAKEQEKLNRLLEAFSQRPIAYQKIYAEITGSVTAGLLLSQIVYWWFAVGERQFYKTNDEFRRELAMGPREFKTGKSKLKELKIISTARRGVPAKTFYKLEAAELLGRIASWAEMHQLDRTRRPNCTGRNEPNITKTNTRDYTENTRQQERISPEKRLELDLKIAQARNRFCDEIGRIFHLTKNEQTTFARITKHLVNLCQSGEAEPSIFEAAIGWAREAKTANVRNKKGLFVAKVKQETGFKSQSNMLSKSRNA